MSAASPDEVMRHIERGSSVAAIALLTHWPARQIMLLAARHGYLPSAEGALSKPPPVHRRSIPDQRTGPH
jgi:hypothetical protein